MLKVLHFFKTALPVSVGGVEKVIDQISREVKIYNIESSVLALTSSSKFPSNFEFNGYNLYLIKRSFQFASTDIAFSAFNHFSSLAKQFDIIHYHFPWPFMDLVHFACRVNKPSLVTYHSDIVRQKNLLLLYSPLMNSFLSSVNEIIVTSPNYLETSEVLKKYKNKTSVIPIGLNRNSYCFTENERTQFWKNQFGARFYLFVGVLRYYKGIDILLEANVGCDIPVVIVGDGPLKEKLQLDAKRLGLKNTYFLGALSDQDKEALLSLCYGFLFPSHLRSEAFGISLLEGAMYGKPMISCEIGTGTSYINIHNLTGLVVSPKNPQALRHAMIFLWNNPEIAFQMGKNAGQRFEEKFTAQRMAKKYSDVYYRLSDSIKDNH